jgi:uncharacterized membrane protein YvbJ
MKDSEINHEEATSHVVKKFESSEEVVKFLSEAIDHVESQPKEKLVKTREKLAKWLHSEFNISIKEMKLNMEDGKPYLVAEYLNDENEPVEVFVDVQRWEENFK